MNPKIEDLALNLKPSKSHEPLYFQAVDPEKADIKAEELIKLVVVDKVYRDAHLSSRKVSDLLGVKPRELSAIVNMRFSQSFPALINEYRIKEVQFLLKDLRLRNKSVWEIGQTVGFKNRQSFYAAFTKMMGYSPHEWRKRFLPRLAK